MKNPNFYFSFLLWGLLSLHGATRLGAYEVALVYNICMCVCMHVCMHVCMYVGMYVCMSVGFPPLFWGSMSVGEQTTPPPSPLSLIILCKINRQFFFYFAKIRGGEGDFTFQKKRKRKERKKNTRGSGLGTEYIISRKRG